MSRWRDVGCRAVGVRGELPVAFWGVGPAAMLAGISPASFGGAHGILAAMLVLTMPARLGKVSTETMRPVGRKLKAAGRAEQ